MHAQEDWPGFGQKVWEAMSTTKFNTQNDKLANKLFLGYQQVGRADYRMEHLVPPLLSWIPDLAG